ncbi:MAG: hypothetical protein ACPGTT_07795, partial [Candidatus Poseidoniaceae archaeon]
DWAPNDANETVDSDNDGVGDNADAFPNDDSETLDTDGDGVGDNAQAIAEAAAAKQKEEDEKRRNLIIIGVVSVIVIGLAVGLILKRRSGGGVEVAKDYGYASSEASPQTQASSVTNQLQILNQWTDDSGYTWRKMSDGSHHYWDGSQWIKHS